MIVSVVVTSTLLAEGTLRLRALKNPQSHREKS
jgi:hypothetical protein